MDESRKPHPKVVAGTLAGALAVLTIGALHRAGIDLSAEEGGALAVVIQSAVAYLKRAN